LLVVKVLFMTGPSVREVLVAVTIMVSVTVAEIVVRAVSVSVLKETSVEVIVDVVAVEEITVWVTTVGVIVLVYVASKNEAQSAEAEAIWVVPRRVPVTARAQLSESQPSRRPKTVAKAA